jgi:hypothetical protein
MPFGIRLEISGDIGPHSTCLSAEVAADAVERVRVLVPRRETRSLEFEPTPPQNLRVLAIFAGHYRSLLIGFMGDPPTWPFGGPEFLTPATLAGLSMPPIDRINVSNEDAEDVWVDVVVCRNP